MNEWRPWPGLGARSRAQSRGGPDSTPAHDATGPAVDVFRVALDRDEAVVARAVALLDPEERIRLARFKPPAKRREFALTRAALRTVLAARLGVRPDRLRFAFGEHGKPTLAEPADPLGFNVSHSHAIALIALAAGVELGIDVEKARERTAFAAIARRFFSPAERAALEALPEEAQALAFYRGWARKEAVIKGNGRGIALGLDRFDVTLGPNEAPRLIATRWDPQEAACWTLEELDVGPGYTAAIAVRARCWRLRTWQYDG